MLTASLASVGHAEEPLPSQLKNVGIVENLGASLPLQLSYLDETGAAVTLQSVFDKGKPVIVNLAYYECPMLCNQVMNGMLNGLRGMRWAPGKEFEIITLSIDPKETSKLATAKKLTYMSGLARPGTEKGWHFWTGAEPNIRALAGTLGFNYALDSATGQYAHAAGIFVASPQGKISRYLYGTEFKAKDLKIALLEASEGKSISIGDKILMFCYSYDPDRRSYVLFARNTMRTGGYFFIAAIGLFLGMLWYRDLKRQKAMA